eukprot:jgi/Mesen1/7004/ME000365S06137
MASLVLQSTCVSLGKLSVCCSTSQVTTASSVSVTSSRLSSANSFRGLSLQAQRPSIAAVVRHPVVIVTAAERADKKTLVKKKMDSAVKRAKIAEVRRLYNRSRKSEIATRMKKVFIALEKLRKSSEPTQEALLDIEKLISEAYKIIDKSVKVGTIHHNKGANRKSRLARAKRAVCITHGWYTPEPATASA